MTGELGEWTTAELNSAEAAAEAQLLEGDLGLGDRERLVRRLAAIAFEREVRRRYAEAVRASALQAGFGRL